MKKLVFIFFIFLNSSYSQDDVVIKNIFDTSLTKSKAYEWLDYLSNQKVDQIRKRVLEAQGYLTVIKSPENVKSSAEIFTIDPIKFKISQNIKKSFDPKRIFNPGKMYTGI